MLYQNNAQWHIFDSVLTHLTSATLTLFHSEQTALTLLVRVILLQSDQTVLIHLLQELDLH
jgi:hypothetical protein